MSLNQSEMTMSKALRGRKRVTDIVEGVGTAEIVAQLVAAIRQLPSLHHGIDRSLVPD